MSNKVQYSYAAILFLSILLYGIPFEWGGYALRFFIGLILFILFIYLVSILWEKVSPKYRVTSLLWVVNSVIALHLILIFVYLMINPNFTFVIGSILGFLFYRFVINRIL